MGGYFKKPESLLDANQRLADVMRESDEPVSEWAAGAGASPHTFRGWVKGLRTISSRNLLRLDDMMGRAFLTPPERDWALMAAHRADRHPARRA